MDIKVTKPTEEELEELKVKSWPIWEKEESSFDWHYDDRETCYLLEGEVEVESADGNIISFASGDLVTFPKGLSCKWNVKKKVRKHYNFG